MSVDNRHIADDEYRQTMAAAFERAAKLMLERDFWRTQWRIEVDQCVFKFKVEGYAKWRSPRWEQQQAERRELMKELGDDETRNHEP
jgi:hypothetical protein